MTSDDRLAGYDGSRSSPPTATPGPIPPRAAPDTTSLLGPAVAAIVVAALYLAQDVLVPITLAVMLSFVLSPLTNLLRRMGLWRTPAVALSVLVALAVIGMLGTLIGRQAAGLAAEAPRYAEAIEHKVAGVQALATARLDDVLRALRISGETPAPPRTSAFTVARSIVEPILGPLETTFIVLIVAVFILVQKEDLRDRFIRVFGAADLHRTTLALDEAGERLSRFFISQLAVNACFGLVLAVGLWAIGVPTPALWGGLAALLRFVPYIGPVLAVVPPLALGAAIDPGWSTAIAVALLFVVVEPLTAYVVEPLLYR